MDTGLKADSLFDLISWAEPHLDRIESALECWVVADPPSGMDRGAPAELVVAMRYAVLDGGKRLRPLLVMAAWEAAVGESSNASRLCEDIQSGGLEAALRAACAVELIHAYSLVHDDMPCMDNDVLRRGKSTVHVKFGEASALLAGDALQALAFELLTPEAGMSADRQAGLCRLLARAAGSAGMAGGQAIDLASVGATLSEVELREMHRLKTGALLQASVMMGASLGNLSDTAAASLRRYGEAIGLAFQVVDDVLDVTADSLTLGKTAGKDAGAGKPTYVSVLGVDRSAEYAQSLLKLAREALAQSGLPDTQALDGLADMVVNRAN